MQCQHMDSHCGKQVMVYLPQLRVNPAPPFAISSLDHAGPLLCCPGIKICMLLFTCVVTNAFLSELVSSLSGEETLLAIWRFISRRGMPAVPVSDNAKVFNAVAAKKVRVLGPEGPVHSSMHPLERSLVGTHGAEHQEFLEEVGQQEGSQRSWTGERAFRDRGYPQLTTFDLYRKWPRRKCPFDPVSFLDRQTCHVPMPW